MEKSKAEAKSQPIPGRCQFFLEKKRRYCRTMPPMDMKYCVEHSHVLGEDAGRKRISCPLNPKHSCYEDQLQKHLKKCNSRERDQPSYYSRGINAGPELSQEEKVGQVSIRDASDAEVLQLMDKVNSLLTEHALKVEEGELFHPVLQQEADKPDYGAPALKHIKQQASLIAHLKRLGRLTDNVTYIEFGAGKGHMSHWIEQALPCGDNTSFLLVDRSACRYKFDVQHREGPAFDRIRIDIEHLKLDAVPSVQEKGRPVVAISKHLCGAATDLTLRCLRRYEEGGDVSSSDSASAAKRPRVSPEPSPEPSAEQDSCPEGSSRAEKCSGLVIALCCHHRCSWHSYAGRAFLAQRGVTARQFALLVSLVGWATCGFVDGKAIGDDEHDCGPPAFSVDGMKSLSELTNQQKEETGRRCKRLLDLGRVMYLREAGFEVSLVRYISGDITPENIALIAVK